jgi:hypothetical protein
MGLDITAYSKLAKNVLALDEDGEPLLENYLDTHAKAWINPDWPERGEGLEDDAWYTYGQSMGFRAGSYSGYSDWREALAKLAGYPETETESASFGARYLSSAACWNGATGPFSELIDFSDCEGTLGPVVSKKLLEDFVTFDLAARTIGGRFYERYAEWKQAFELAADDGMVCFH